MPRKKSKIAATTVLDIKSAIKLALDQIEASKGVDGRAMHAMTRFVDLAGAREPHAWVRQLVYGISALVAH